MGFGFGFGVQDVGFQGLGFVVQGFGFRVQDLGCGVKGFWFSLESGA